jgi:hypothetical protein
MGAGGSHWLALVRSGSRYEPVSAAYDFAERFEQARTVLIADFGGGTSDLTAVRMRPNDFSSKDVFAVGGIAKAGDALDCAFVRRVVAPLVGSLAPFRRAQRCYATSDVTKHTLRDRPCLLGSVVETGSRIPQAPRRHRGCHGDSRNPPRIAPCHFNADPESRTVIWRGGASHRQVAHHAHP